MSSSTRDWLIPYSDLSFASPVGVGASGEVFQANYSGNVVAVKRLFSSVWEPAAFENAFKNEASILCRMHHPNVVRFFGASYDSGRFHIVTEFCPYTTKALVSGRTVPRHEMYHIVTGIAKGLAYLHTKKVAHRDLKPGNILLSKDLDAKLCGA